MRHDPADRLTDAELTAFFSAMYPDGVAGSDVIAEIAPGGWEKSPLVACFHPSAAREFDEERQFARRLVELGIAEPVLPGAQVISQDQPLDPLEEVTELVGLCLWDVFSDNHEVRDTAGRTVDLGSFRGASAFLDDYVSGRGHDWRESDSMRFYMGTFAIAGRADLTPVYASIFRRLAGVGGDWVYEFPEIHLVDFGAGDDGSLARLRNDLTEANQRAREAAMDRPAPATVRAYRQVNGRDPRGWPPA